MNVPHLILSLSEWRDRLNIGVFVSEYKIIIKKVEKKVQKLLHF